MARKKLKSVELLVNGLNIRKVKGTVTYFISDCGRVFSFKELNPSPNRKDYMRVGLKVNGKRKQEYVHRIVAEAFIGKVGNIMEIDHIDRDPMNNHVSNLRIVSKQENLENREFNKEEKEPISDEEFKNSVEKSKLLVPKDTTTLTKGVKVVYKTRPDDLPW